MTADQKLNVALQALRDIERVADSHTYTTDSMRKHCLDQARDIAKRALAQMAY